MPSEPPEFEVEFYRGPDGEKPVANWLRKIAASNPDLADRCKAALRRFELDLTYHRSPHTKDIGRDLFELRILGKDGARILYFYAGERRAVMVHAFMKKSGETPPNDRRTAERAMQAWRKGQTGSLGTRRSTPR